MIQIQYSILTSPSSCLLGRGMCWPERICTVRSIPGKSAGSEAGLHHGVIRKTLIRFAIAPIIRVQSRPAGREAAARLPQVPRLQLVAAAAVAGEEGAVQQVLPVVRLVVQRDWEQQTVRHVTYDLKLCSQICLYLAPHQQLLVCKYLVSEYKTRYEPNVSQSETARLSMQIIKQ